MPPPKYTPPRAPSVSAKSPATPPKNAHSNSSAHTAEVSLSSSAKALMAAGSPMSLAVRPCTARTAWYRLTSPWPEMARSADTWPKRWRKCSMTSNSKRVCAASDTCPPSPEMGAPRGALGPNTRPDIPKPVPGPSSAIAAPSTAAPPPTWRSRWGSSSGTARASAVKSLISTKR